MSLSFSWFFSLEQNENSKEEKAGTKHYVSTAHSKFRISCVLLSCGAVGSKSDWHLLGILPQREETGKSEKSLTSEKVILMGHYSQEQGPVGKKSSTVIASIPSNLVFFLPYLLWRKWPLFSMMCDCVMLATNATFGILDFVFLTIGLSYCLIVKLLNNLRFSILT